MAAIDITIPIHVHPNDNPPDGRAGTFTAPHALVKAAVGDTIKWKITPANLAFQVKFSGDTPLEDEDEHPVFVIARAPRSQDGSSATYNAAQTGHFHYTLIVSDGNSIWEITNCPELDVG